jgi:hypothetical protein
MLLRAAYSRGLCLRCRFRALHQNAPPIIPAHPSRCGFRPLRLENRRAYSAHANITEEASTGEINESDGKAAGSDQPKNELQTQDLGEADGGNGTSALVITDGHDSVFPKIRYISKSPRRSNKGASHDAENIGVDMLGKPASVILLRNKRRRRTPQATPDDSQGLATPRIDFVQELDSEKKDVTLEEAFRNINELRPEEGTPLNLREYQSLESVLSNGFSMQQLQAYIDQPSNLESSSYSNPTTPKYPWIKFQSPWSPSARLNLKTSAKGKVVARLMRQCWGLQVRELNAASGCLRLTIGRRDLMVLLRTAALEDIAQQDVLGEGGMELDMSKSLLKIFGSKDKTEKTVDALDRCMQRVATATIGLEAINGKKPDDTLIERVSSLTNSFIYFKTPKPGKKELVS